MPTGPVPGVLDQLRRAAQRDQDAALTDGELLAHYLARRDESAFEELVRRHGPMVLGVCRRVLGHAGDAEDAFQAAFLVLVRKASSIRPRAKVATWLHGVAYLTALKARAAAIKRRDRERRAAEMGRTEAPADPWADLLPLLDHELRLLPERYRVPIVLCELEGKSHKEAARQMGWPEGTLAGRLSRARALLARRMARHGAALSVATLALSPAVVSTALASSTARAAVAYAAGNVLVSANVIALAEGALKTMFLSTLKATMAFLLVIASVGAAVAFGVPGGENRPVDPQPAKAEKATPPDPDEKLIREYIEELRAAVKKPTDDKQVYRLVIDPRFYKAVRWAARRGDEALVVELIRDYSGPNNPDRGASALTWAAWLNNADTVKLLLARGVKVNAGDNEGRTALHEAARWGGHLVKPLLEKGADVNARTKKGETPVMAAAAAEQPDSLRLMLEKETDVNARDDDGKTPLMYAAENGRLANARALLAQGANVRLKDKKGKTALDLLKPSNDFLPGAITEEGLKRHQAKVEGDAEQLRALLKRAGG
ncbi:MAG TPA: sigma-70 family RNA polymerase sigma factor [Gemmata sp.]|nr:sigma-70 family RNA polymerase sigma factor [Gemmata sp.]